VNWGQLFLAIDRLRRQGDITLRSEGDGQYMIVLTPNAITGDPQNAA
jgi:hypothetical protein